MTPKEKAEELVKKYEIQFLSFGDYLPTIKSKQCALIAVDEIIKALPPFTYGLEFVAKIEYWTNVKKEIENL
jgi:hypothetical protein